MIKSGLPYSKEDIIKVYNEGAVVNMNDVNFPNCKTLEENYKVALTYLRNTGFDTDFDFSDMSYEAKRVLIKQYLTTKIAYDIPSLDDTVLALLFATAGIEVSDAKSILSREEIISFLQDEFEFVKEIWEFLVSLPIFAISRLNIPNISLEKVPVNEIPFEYTNFVNVIKIPAFDRLYDFADAFVPQFYKEIFTEDNNVLFEALQGLGFMVILDSMCSKTPEEFKKVLEGITLGI